MQATREIILPAVTPFDLHATVEALRRRPNNLVEGWVDGEYRRVLALLGRPTLLGVRQVGLNQIIVRMLDAQTDDAVLAEGAAMLTDVLGIGVDLTEARARAQRLPALAPLVERLAGMKPPRFPSLWETLLAIIPFQQVSLAAGIAILNRLVEALGPRVEHEGRLYHGLPSAATVLAAPIETLRASGLSAAKAATVRGVAERTLDGELDARTLDMLSDDQAVARLTRLPGIGPWTAQLVLLRGLRRLSVFPQGDSGATRTLASVLDVPIAQAREEAKPMLAALGPYRGYLYFLLLGSRLLRQGILTGTAEGASI